MQHSEPYLFRPYLKEDLNFIQSSWGHSYYNSLKIGTFLKPEAFHSYHRPIREKILNKPTATIVVCAATEDPNVILGWIAIETIPGASELILHYLYLKESARREKIAWKLFRAVLDPSKTIFVSHLTPTARKILQNHSELYRLKYIPHLI